ncbi:MAG: hypothetical protein SV760_02200, partial [Halobacteria archaeon]|nr:hypothetical protein [Halobacteria archaeon]
AVSCVMRILDWLLDRGDEPSYYKEGEGSQVGAEADVYYFVDEFSEGSNAFDDVLKSRLIIGPHPEDGRNWGVLVCNRSIRVPEGSKLHVVERGDIVNIGDEKPYYSVLAQLVHPDDLERWDVDEKDEVTDFPEELAGIDIPEGGDWGEDELEMLALSFNPDNIGKEPDGRWN